MGFTYITSIDSPNFGYPDGAKGQNKANKIIIHHWGSDGQKFDNVVSWLCNPRAGVSAHFVVESGKAACLVDWSNAAWHGGSKGVNTTSIGIECRPECTSGDMDTTAQVVAMIWKGYGKKLPLYGHKDFAATACPGRYYTRLKELFSLAEKYYQGENQVPTPPQTEYFKVKVNIPDLYIRAGAGTNTAKKGFIPKGVYTIVETKTNGGIEWGKLKSGAGWIALKYTERI